MHYLHEKAKISYDNRADIGYGRKKKGETL